MFSPFYWFFHVSLLGRFVSALRLLVVSMQNRSATNSMSALIGISMFFAGLAELLEMNDNVTPFTAQEWMWAFQGGYLDTMVSHFFRNGGL
jgi:hypothetical protein